MKKVKLLGILPVIMLALFSTSVLASSVYIPTFVVDTSVVKASVGSNTYSMVKKVNYNAEIEGVTLALGQKNAKYDVTPATNSANLGSTFKTQTLQVSNPYVCASLGFTANYNVSGTYNFYVTGRSGIITNSVTLE